MNLTCMVDMEVEPFSRSVLHVIHLTPCFTGGVKKKFGNFCRIVPFATFGSERVKLHAVQS